MTKGSLSPDDELLLRLQAPPDLRDGIESLNYWRGRRARLAWYRRRARREAGRMVVVWEGRVRAAVLEQPGVPLWTRLRGARLAAIGPVWRFARRGLALSAAVLVLLAVAPALLALEIVLSVM